MSLNKMILSFNNDDDYNVDDDIKSDDSVRAQNEVELFH